MVTPCNVSVFTEKYLFVMFYKRFQGVTSVYSFMHLYRKLFLYFVLLITGTFGISLRLVLYL